MDPQPRRHRVLVVDDSLDMVQSMALLLRGLGHEVDFAINGHAAMEVARRFRPDVVLMDIGLPGMSGLEATRRLRERLPGATVVAITVHDGEAQRAAAVAAGAVAFVAKRRIHEELALVLKPLLEDRLRRARAAGAPNRRSANNGA